MISLAELREYVGITDPEDTSQDANLTAMEAAAVAYIQMYTQRYFGPPEEVEEIVEGEGRRRLYLRDIPIEPAPDEDYPLSIEPLTVVDSRTWAGASSVAIEETTYDLRRDGLEAYLVRHGYRGRWECGNEYIVTYWRGYWPGEEPADIRQLVKDMVKSKYLALTVEGLKSETIGGYSYTQFSPRELETLGGAAGTLDLWRRLVFA